jgi:anti-sigma B factor antagonist
VVVSLVGAVDLHHTPGVHKALVTACEERPRRLVINLTEVTYMDSSGIGTLVEVFRRVNGYQGKLVLCGLNERVRSVFEITKLDKFFSIHSTEDEALNA